MPEVVLVNCRGRIVPERREHLGLGCLSSYLRREGIDTEIVDGHFDRLDAQDIARRLGELRPWIALVGVGGALVGLAWAVRRRWSDGEVALYLDARLDGDEAISTAVELDRRASGAS
ncbi:MAG TPA: hypothetical protein PKM43_23750, partial [Verrucomicrobiota bacterium]|nr:hypothetical protein [Verrucomicrobiota bacterium]